MTSASSAPSLILGGHSFIAQLGNDRRPSESEIDALVTTCLDLGVRTFDTTYRPERLALGASLARLGRRTEARLIAWNFFKLFGDDEANPGGPEPWRDDHLDALLDDFQTDFVDELVVHRVGDPARDEAQEKTALRWQAAGKVERIGVWSPGPNFAAWQRCDAYAFVVEPCNAFTPAAPARIAAYHAAGAEVYGCSPFVRGWQLDRLVEAAGAESNQAEIAALLLRAAAFTPHVDALIVSMRQAAWVEPNLTSIAAGPLSSEERTQLESWLQKLTPAIS